MTRGVLYYLGSKSHVRPFGVSIWSLRKYYDGPIHLFISSKLDGVADRVTKRYRASIDLLDDTDHLTLARHLANKVRCLSNSPYTQTVFLDADTVIHDPIDPLFECCIGLTLMRSDDPNFRLLSNNGTSRRRLRKLLRAKQLMSVEDRKIEKVLAVNPREVNTGVCSVQAHHPFLQRWKELAHHLASDGIDDEIAATIALIEYEQYIKYYSDRWNAVWHLCSDWQGHNHIRHFTRRAWRKMKIWRNYRRQMIHENQRDYNLI